MCLYTLQRSTWETTTVTSQPASSELFYSNTIPSLSLSLSIRHACTHKWRIYLGAKVLLKFNLGRWIHLCEFSSTVGHWTHTHTRASRTPAQSSASNERGRFCSSFVIKMHFNQYCSVYLYYTVSLWAVCYLYFSFEIYCMSHLGRTDVWYVSSILLCCYSDLLLPPKYSITNYGAKLFCVSCMACDDIPGNHLNTHKLCRDYCVTDTRTILLSSTRAGLAKDALSAIVKENCCSSH